MQHLTLVFGMALAVAGVLLLFAGWRARRAGRRSQRTACTSAGWLLLALSLVPWIVLGGNDRGVALAILAFMLAGSALVLYRGTQHQVGRARNGESDLLNGNGNGNDNSGRGLLMRRVWVFLLAGPISFAVAMLGTATIYAAWTGSAANRLAVTMLIVPVIWTALAIYATYDISLKQRSTIVMGLLGACGLALFVLLPEMT